MDKLSPPERKSLEEQLRLHKDEDIFVGKLPLVVDAKKKKVEDRIFLIGKHRVYLFKAGGKVLQVLSLFWSNTFQTYFAFDVNMQLSLESHLLEILDVFSINPKQLVIKTKKSVIEFPESIAENVVEEILAKLLAAYSSSFPGRADSFPLKISPETRIANIKKKAGKLWNRSTKGQNNLNFVENFFF